jgi:predicted transcriptional regulator
VRRNDLDICADLLKVTMNGAKKTQMVYRANLNFKIIKNYITRLSEYGFLESERGQYFTTDKGNRFLVQYREITEPFGFSKGIDP